MVFEFPFTKPSNLKRLKLPAKRAFTAFLYVRDVDRKMNNACVFRSFSSFCSLIQALIESNFLWDSSISTKTTDKPIWPYTLDYAIPHECKIKSCPNKVNMIAEFFKAILFTF